MLERTLALLGLGLGVVVVCLLLPLLVVVALVSSGGGAPVRLPPGSGIPAAYLPLYAEAQRVFKVNWLLLAAIHKHETDFGRSTLPGVSAGVNFAGCCAGPMQFNLLDTWSGYQWAYRKGNRPDGDYPLHKRTLAACAGRRDERNGCVYDSFDAIMAAAQKLRSQGAGMDLRAPGVRDALCGYNCLTSYMDDVQGQALDWERQLATLPGGVVELGDGRLAWPVRGPVTSGFGPRWGRMHEGVDIAVPAGTTIRAAEDGLVVWLGWFGGYGNFTCLRHAARLSTCYAHQSAYLTRRGERVERGQAIGRVGCTGHCFGDHLHFEVHLGPGWGDQSAVDPLPFLR